MIKHTRQSKSLLDFPRGTRSKRINPINYSGPLSEILLSFFRDIGASNRAPKGLLNLAPHKTTNPTNPTNDSSWMQEPKPPGDEGTSRFFHRASIKSASPGENPTNPTNDNSLTQKPELPGDEGKDSTNDNSWMYQLNPIFGEFPKVVKPENIYPENPSEADKKRFTRGVRNNSPGNVRFSASNDWDGQIGEDEGYAVFESMIDGMRAAAITVMTYQKKHGLETIEEIITRYAPPDDNKTASYIQHIYDQLAVSAPEFQIKRGQVIDLHKNPKLLRIVMATMFKHEIGDSKYISLDDFDQGITRAWNYIDDKYPEKKEAKSQNNKGEE